MTFRRSKISILSRIKSLINFLENISSELIVIAFQDDRKSHESVTIVGNLFLAESTTYKNDEGFTNTFFTRNATEITKRIKDFDDELNELLKKNDWTPENSREKAIEELNRILSEKKE